MGDKKYTILVVDDTETNIDILVDLLVDYDLLVALDGFSAIEIAQSEHIDLVLLDIMMPQIDGYEVCKILKSNDKTKDVPIIFITANTSEEAIETAYDVGGIDYITKPIRPKELLSRVATQLDLSHKTKHLEQIINEQLKALRDKDLLLIQKSKMADMGEMIATIAHQIKQPISVIKAVSSSAILDKQLTGSADIDYLCESINEQTRFMTDTIDLFRNFFNPNKLKESMQLSDIIKYTTNILSGLILNIHITKSIETTNKIKVYKNDLIQCCMNIIKNAIDVFDEKNIKQKAINIQVYEEEGYHTITIQDNGGGVPEHLKERIFEQYFTTKSEDRGTGIGLDLVKQIIQDKHNGIIYVANEPIVYDGVEYIGAKFYIKIPNNL